MSTRASHHQRSSERREAVGQFARVVLVQEEVVVVELHRVDAVFPLLVRQDGRGALRRLHLLAVEHRHHAAEIAAERAADAGHVHRRARSQKCPQRCTSQRPDGDTGYMGNRPAIAADARRLCTCRPNWSLKESPRTASNRARRADRLDQLEERIFALARTAKSTYFAFSAASV